jgi:hypothetical protein
MNQLLNSLRSGAPRTTTTTDRTLLSNLAFGVCSALMPYALATLLLVAFG